MQSTCMQSTACPLIVLVLFASGGVWAQPPRVWIVDQGQRNTVPNPTNRILEIDPVNKKDLPDAEGDAIILRTVPSPAESYCDELTFDDQDRLWVVVKNRWDGFLDGLTRIDKETGDVQIETFPWIPPDTWGGVLEGLAWDGSGLWVTAFRANFGPNGSVLSRVDPLTGNQIAPFDSGPLGAAKHVRLPGNHCQGLLYDPSDTGYLWSTDWLLNKIYKVDLARLYDADPTNDDYPVIAEFDLPIPAVYHLDIGPKGIDWMGDKIWICNCRDGIYEFDPTTGTAQKVFSTPQWTIDGIAILPPRLAVQAVTPTSITRSAWVGHGLTPDVITVTNTAAGTLRYWVGRDAVPWLSISPTSGRSTGETDPITLTYDLSGLQVGTYHATITVTSRDASNSPQTVDVNITVQTVKPDLDGDGDVDQEDFGLFQACLSGAGVEASPGCAHARFDDDSDVDYDDLIIFENCRTSAGVLASPTCDQ